jgi:hypothetical protein
MAAAAAALSIGVPNALADNPLGGERTGQLARKADEANLVFIGDVVDVAYRNARAEGGESVLPYTFVTYQVREVLRGQAPDRTFTVRFVGGSDGQGRFVWVSGVPRFQPGEQDLLFVKGNGEEGCALVDCEWGRYRILKEAIYNAYGAPVFAIDKVNAIARGLPPEEFRTFRYPAPVFDELIKNPEVERLFREGKLNVDEARKRYETEAPKQIELRQQFPAAQGVDSLGKEEQVAPERLAVPAQFAPRAMTREAFVAEVKRVAGEAKRSPVALKSADAKREIVIKALQRAVPKQLAAPPIRRPPGTPEEEAEIKALEANGFNPVIKR